MANLRLRLVIRYMTAVNSSGDYRIWYFMYYNNPCIQTSYMMYVLQQSLHTNKIYDLCITAIPAYKQVIRFMSYVNPCIQTNYMSYALRQFLRKNQVIRFMYYKNSCNTNKLYDFMHYDSPCIQTSNMIYVLRQSLHTNKLYDLCITTIPVITVFV